MDFKFSKDSEDNRQQAISAKKGSQSLQLVVLLALMSGFAYVYFFTGMIKPLPEEKKSEAPAPLLIKKTLPQREGGATTAVTPTAGEVKKDVSDASSIKTKPPKVAQTVPVPAEKKPLPSPVEKKEQKPVAAKLEAQKTPAVKQKTPVTADNNRSATAVADKKVVAAVIKPADREKQSGAGVLKPRKAVVAHVKKPAPVAAASKAAASEAGERWTVVVGNYLLEDAMAVDMARVRKAGFEASIKPGGRMKAQMNRLFLAEYDDHTTAQAELDKLMRHTSDAFILGQAGKYAVYAGSYLLADRVTSEKERLAAAGFPLTLIRAEVSIPSKCLTAGSFGNRKAAEAALKKLTAAGLKSTLVRD